MADPGKKKSPSLYSAFLIVLALGAVAAGYLIYFQPPPPELEEHVVYSDFLGRLSRLKSKVYYRFTEKELGHSSEPDILLGPKAATESDAFSKAESPADPAFSSELDAKAPIEENPIWVLNVLTSKNKTEVDELETLLSKAPYKHFSYKIEAGGAIWYNLRVGVFSSLEKASAAADELEVKYQIPPPKIINPSPMELEIIRTLSAETGDDEDGQ